MKQKTIGINPLEEYLSGTKEQSKADASPKQEASAPTPTKQRITLYISAEVVDRVKNAVYWEPGLTLAGFAEEALERTLNELEEKRGEPFAQRKEHRLRGGRPLS